VKAEISPGISTADLDAKAKAKKQKQSKVSDLPSASHHRRESPEKGRKGSMLLHRHHYYPLHISARKLTDE